MERQLARWLLTALDRLPGHEVVIDHGALAVVLGVSADALAGAVAQLVGAGALVCVSLAVFGALRLRRLAL